ncbi:hypothetical protein IFM89_024825 [Coptis chinensis]|uniref:GDSL esterase/lipase n=1 Tax=Coptis chinensis TaxID=261450 RepID=A0A835HPY0_9MAGN|nr:hypothetical protein IFM89_024825 [Coptis chinensis]
MGAWFVIQQVLAMLVVTMAFLGSICEAKSQALGWPFLSPYLLSIGSNYKHGANYATSASTVLFPNTSLFVSGTSPFSLGIQLNQMKAFKARVLELGPSAFLVELPHSSSDLDEYGCMKSYNNAVADYNNMLRDMLGQTRKALPDASVIYVDIHSVYLELFRHPKNHGLIYGTKVCCGQGDGDYNFNPQVFCGNTKLIGGRNVTAKACRGPLQFCELGWSTCN